MYELMYDEVTSQYFMNDPENVRLNLKKLERKLIGKPGYFTLNDYCDAIGVEREEPFTDKRRFYHFEFDIPFVFVFDKSWDDYGPITRVSIDISIGPALSIYKSQKKQASYRK